VFEVMSVFKKNAACFIFSAHIPLTSSVLACANCQHTSYMMSDEVKRACLHMNSQQTI
jgi:hypothetical protein